MKTSNSSWSAWIVSNASSLQPTSSRDTYDAFSQHRKSGGSTQSIKHARRHTRTGGARASVGLVAPVLECIRPNFHRLLTH